MQTGQPIKAVVVRASQWNRYEKGCEEAVKRRPPVVIIRKRSTATTNDDSSKTTERPSRRGSRGQSTSGGGEEASRGGGRPERKPKQSHAARPSRKASAADSKKPLQKKDSEKLARRKAANELAESAGIPVAYAHRILQGQTTLKEVTQKLMRKAKLQALVRDEGLDPSLAGQVEAGKLKLERARVINKMRTLRPHSVSKDGFHLAGESEGPVAVQCFGKDWLVGKVPSQRYTRSTSLMNVPARHIGWSNMT